MWCVCFITFGCQKLFSSLQDQIYMIYSNGAQQNLYCCKITRVLKPKFHNKLDPTAWTNSFKLLLWKGLTLPSSKPHGSAMRWDKFNRKNIHELHSISFGMLPIATHPSEPCWLSSGCPRCLHVPRGSVIPQSIFPSHVPTAAYIPTSSIPFPLHNPTLQIMRCCSQHWHFKLLLAFKPGSAQTKADSWKSPLFHFSNLCTRALRFARR